MAIVRVWRFCYGIILKTTVLFADKQVDIRK
jgi:hypothetical protein